jgi:redox-sensitive bicupin YhaK (pirin superfamily)
MGFRALRVINEDRVQPGEGFGMHGHQDMEIITYVLEGALEHRDSLGTGSVLRPGEFQRMSAGTGIRHSEFNPSPSEPVHLYQIWLLPNEKGLAPSYEQKAFAEQERQNRLRLVASPDAQDGSLLIHQDARVYLATLDADQEVRHELQPSRRAWLQVLRGAVVINGQSLGPSDGVAISGTEAVAVRATVSSELLLFDMT